MTVNRLSLNVSRRALAVVPAAALTVSVLPAVAVTSSNPELPETVTADVLPTPQINGVVWDQAVAGDIVVAGGSFTSARPFGAAPGENETPRSHVLAFSLTTGELLPFAPQINGQVRAVALTPDAQTLIIGGDFTEVGGSKRYRAAAFDMATGRLLDSFLPSFDYIINSIGIHGDTVYFGGKFSVASNTPRKNTAAYSLSTSKLLDWAPQLNDGRVLDLAVKPDGSQVILAGSFTGIDDRDEPGWVAVDATTGAARPWEGNEYIVNAGDNAAIYSVAADDERVYITGYQFYGGVPFENVAAASWDGGRLDWVSGCRGDTYDVTVAGDVIYYTGHPHDCAMIDGVPEPANAPRQYQRANAATADPSPLGRVNEGGNFDGWVAPELLEWRPEINIGTFTGQDQGAWTIESHGDYVLLGGEFTRVSGVKQQGLARFAKPNIAPNKIGPVGQMEPTLTSVEGARVTIAATTASDRDDEMLTYDLTRDGVVVATMPARSRWFDTPAIELIDEAAPTGTVEYVVVARDADGNELRSTPLIVEVTDGVVPMDPKPVPDREQPSSLPDGDPIAYRDAIALDRPLAFWQLEEQAGPFAPTTGRRELAVSDAVQRGTTGVFEGTSSANFSAAADFGAALTKKDWGPQTFTIEAWVRTTSDAGGVIANFGDAANAPSWGKDRFVSMTDSGQLQFGVYSGGAKVIRSEGSYNDGAWHHVAATLGSDGMRLVVDGELAAANPDVTGALRMWGFWRIGHDAMGGWPGAPTSNAFDGLIDEVSLFTRALPTARLAEHYAAGIGMAPTAGDPEPRVLEPVDEPAPSPVDEPVAAPADPNVEPGSAIVGADGLEDAAARGRTVVVAESMRAAHGDVTHRWASTDESVIVAQSEHGLVVSPEAGGSATILGRDVMAIEGEVSAAIVGGIASLAEGEAAGVAAQATEQGHYRAVLRNRGRDVYELAVESVTPAGVEVLKRKRVDVPRDGAVTVMLQVGENRGGMLKAAVIAQGEPRRGWSVVAKGDKSTLGTAGSAGIVVDGGEGVAARPSVTFNDVVITQR